MSAPPPPGDPTARGIPRPSLREACKTAAVFLILGAAVVAIANYSPPPPTSAGSRPEPGGDRPAGDARAEWEEGRRIERIVDAAQAGTEAVTHRAESRRPTTGPAPRSGAPAVAAKVPAPNLKPAARGVASLVTSYLQLKQAADDADREREEQEKARQPQSRTGEAERARSQSVGPGRAPVPAAADARPAVEVTITAPDQQGYRSVVVHNPSTTGVAELQVTARRGTPAPGGERTVIGRGEVPGVLQAGQRATVLLGSPYLVDAPTHSRGRIMLQSGDSVEVSAGTTRVRTVAVP